MQKENTMRELIYAMRFTGQAVPASADGTVLRAETTAPSLALTATVDEQGLTGELCPVAGREAAFESEVTFTGERAFQEVGTIAFGNGHRLRFSTVGTGHLDASADRARKHGAVTWRVDGAEGQFGGASGLITSNFFVGDDLVVADHHFGILFLP